MFKALLVYNFKRSDKELFLHKLPLPIWSVEWLYMALAARVKWREANIGPKCRHVNLTENGKRAITFFEHFYSREVHNSHYDLPRPWTIPCVGSEV